MKTVFALLLVFFAKAAAICRFNDGQNYELTWIIDPNDLIHFQLTYRNLPPNFNIYTGIAFGQSMGSGLDAVLVKTINGQVVLSDEYVQGFRPSFPDNSQDAQLQNAQIVGGVLKARFTRPVSAVERFVDHDLHGCTPWHFINGVGMVHDRAGNVGKHTRRPVTQIICIDQCRI
uniref:DOMON domain-containing protein n=1 Tax=Panagrellus redivivus TaxID=6233 RepID=A0A7E4W5E6_PANRE